MIETIAEHQVDISLLKEHSKILDIGARGFAFTKAMKKLGHHVAPVDVDMLDTDESYFKCAIGGTNKIIVVEHNESDPQATKVRDLQEGEDADKIGTPMFTLETFTTMVNEQSRLNVKYWDVCKIDIEGSEYETIMAMTKPMAKQLSVEFHLHTGVYQEAQVEEMVKHLEGLGYTTVSHEKTSQHGLPPNYWSSLFIYNY